MPDFAYNIIEFSTLGRPFIQALYEPGKQGKGSAWVKNDMRHGHFKSCRNLTWPLIKTVEGDVKVL